MTFRLVEDTKENFGKFEGAKAISSDAFFGNEQEDLSDSASNGRDSLGGKLADGAVVVADKVVVGAKAIKEKMGGFLSFIREK